ncbi:MAG: VTT domain-containing protein [Alphaproteobacteria bacterium]
MTIADINARLRAWWRALLGYASTSTSVWCLGFLSFIEAIFFPLPVESLLVPMGLARPRLVFRFAGIATLASVLGGIVGWLLGAFLFDLWELSGLSGVGRDSAAELFSDWGAWIVFAGGFTPIPFKVVSLASGLMGVNLAVFVIFALLSRGARFYLEAVVLRLWGDSARVFIEEHLAWLSLVIVGMLFLLFVFLL